MKKICKNCKWYEKESYQEESDFYGCCCNDDKIYHANEPNKKDECAISAYPFDGASLTVGENFGCIHFKKSE